VYLTTTNSTGRWFADCPSSSFLWTTCADRSKSLKMVRVVNVPFREKRLLIGCTRVELVWLSCLVQTLGIISDYERGQTKFDQHYMVLTLSFFVLHSRHKNHFARSAHLPKRQSKIGPCHNGSDWEQATRLNTTPSVVTGVVPSWACKVLEIMQNSWTVGRFFQ